MFSIGSKNMFVEVNGLRLYQDDIVYTPKEDSFLMIDSILDTNQPIKSALEVGSGSGVVIISLIQTYPKGQYYAIDINFSAALITLKNARTNLLDDNLHVICSSHIHPFRKNSLPPIAIFNPPYLPFDPEIDYSTPKWEIQQLVGGKEGIETVKEFIKIAFIANISKLFVIISSFASSPMKFSKLMKNWVVRIASSKKMHFETIWVLELTRVNHMVN